MFLASSMAGHEDPSPHTAPCYFPHLLQPYHLQLTPPDSSPSPDPAAAAEASPGAGTASNHTPTRRPRGRPPGSKNKPKPPVVLTRDAPNSLRSHVLEFSPGAEILGSLSDYARVRGRGLSILSGSGTVSDVSFRQPGGTSLLNLRGKFEILSLTGTVLPPPAPPGSGGLAIFMTGSQGQVVGGSVSGRLVSAGPVVLMAASFANAVFERLPLVEETEEGGAEGQVGTASQSSVVTGGGGSSGGGTGAGLAGAGGNGNGNGNGDGNNSNVAGFPFGGDFLGWAGNVGRPQF